MVTGGTLLKGTFIYDVIAVLGQFVLKSFLRACQN